MVKLTPKQVEILDASGPVLVTGGPGSGKTTIAILKAAKLAGEALATNQHVLFLSFARATVARVLEAIDEEAAIAPAVRRLIEVDTYHSFFWRIIKSHGYLIGLPRRLSILTPPAEAVALADIRGGYAADSKLSDPKRAERTQREAAERTRLAMEDGKVCFSQFADMAGTLLHGSRKIRRLISTAYPVITLDEFQDTSGDQWRVVQALGENSTLLALADPEQRIFDFIGADPERLNQFKAKFAPKEFDLSTDNHRSAGTEISQFGNDILKGKFGKAYEGVAFVGFEANVNQAMTTLVTQTLQARKRLLATGKKGWTLAVLVPTKRMTRLVSDAFREPSLDIPPIRHSAAVDMEAAILGAEVIAFLLQPASQEQVESGVVDLVAAYYRGKGGDTVSQSSLKAADGIRKAHERCHIAEADGRAPPAGSIFLHMRSAIIAARAVALVGDPDSDWLAVRRALEGGACPRLREIANEVRNVRLLDRGTQLRQLLAADWRDFGAYRNALDITRLAFVQEHFATSHKPETGIVVMNMHKAKGKQFDEVIIFEGWPVIIKRKVVANADRIVRSNERVADMGQARQNLRVSVTRARSRTTILTPRVDPCVLLVPE